MALPGCRRWLMPTLMILSLLSGMAYYSAAGSIESMGLLRRVIKVCNMQTAMVTRAPITVILKPTKQCSYAGCSRRRTHGGRRCQNHAHGEALHTPQHAQQGALAEFLQGIWHALQHKYPSRMLYQPIQHHDIVNVTSRAAARLLLTLTHLAARPSRAHVTSCYCYCYKNSLLP